MQPGLLVFALRYTCKKKKKKDIFQLKMYKIIPLCKITNIAVIGYCELTPHNLCRQHFKMIFPGAI